MYPTPRSPLPPLPSSRAALAALALLLTSPLAAQETSDAPATDSTASFTDQVEVEVFNLDVHVTDRKGRPVTSLDRQDFAVLADGEPIEIRYFYRYGGDATPLEGAQKTPTEDSPADAIEVAPLSLVIYVDSYNLRPQNRARALESVERFLDSHLRSADRAMVIGFGTGLDVVQRFTSDTGTVRAALASLGDTATFGQQADTTREAALDALYAMMTDECDPSVLSIANDYAANIDAGVDRTLEGLRATIETLAGIPGRKALLYVSDGFPTMAGEELVMSFNESCRLQANQMRTLDTRSLPNATQRLRALAQLANTNRVTFYGLEAAGVRAPRDASSPIRQAMTANYQHGLFALAEETGGRAILSGTDFDRELDAVAEDFGHYYAIGLAPTPEQTAALQRDLEVTAAGRGLRVRYRRSFHDKTARESLVERVRAALVLGAEENPLGMTVSSGVHTPREDDPDRVQVPVAIDFPLSHVTFLPEGERWVARLRLLVGIRDGDGRTSPIREAPVVVEVPEAELDAARDSSYRYEVGLSFASGEQTVALGLHDESGQESSFVTHTIQVE